MSRKMNGHFIKTLNRLCGEVENLQHRVDESNHREVYEAIAKAKDSMLDALRAAENA